MNKGKARRRAIQAERKKQKKDGTFVPKKTQLYTYQREAIQRVFERVILMHPIVYFKPISIRQGKVRCKVEVFDE